MMVGRLAPPLVVGRLVGPLVLVTEEDAVTIGFGSVEDGEPPPTGAAPVSCDVVAEFLCFFVPPTAPPTTAATITTAATAMIITPLFVR